MQGQRITCGKCLIICYIVIQDCIIYCFVYLEFGYFLMNIQRFENLYYYIKDTFIHSYIHTFIHILSEPKTTKNLFKNIILYINIILI